MQYREIGQEVNIPLFKYYGNIDYARDAVENSRIHLEPPSAYNDIYDSSQRIGAEDLYHMHFGAFLDVANIRKYCDFLSIDEIAVIKKIDFSVGT